MINKNSLLLTGFVVFLVFSMVTIIAIRFPKFNHSCTVHGTRPLNYNLGFQSLGRYYPYLVQDTKGLTTFTIILEKGSKDFANNLRASYKVICDYNPILSASGKPSSVEEISFNGSTAIEVTWVYKKDVPGDVKECWIEGVIGLENETFFKENPCEDDCSQICYVEGLSDRIFEGERKKTISKEEFYSIRQLEERKQDRIWNIIEMIVSLITGALIALFSSFFAQKWIQERSWKKENINKIYAPLFYELDGRIIPTIKEFQGGSVGMSRVWSGIKDNHFLVWIPEKLRNRLSIFFDKEYWDFGLLVRGVLNNITQELGDELMKRKKTKNDFVMKENKKIFLNTYRPFNMFTSHPRAQIILKGELPKNDQKMSIIEDEYEKLKLFFNLEFDSARSFLKYMIKYTKHLKDINFARKRQNTLLKQAERLKKDLEEIVKSW